MNNLLYEFETRSLECYGKHHGYNENHLLLENPANKALRQDFEELPQRMENPFTNLIRWLRFEVLDLNAILEAIERKNDLEKKKNEKIKKL